MQYPITLVDIAGVIMAAACVRSTVPDVRAAPRKLWRLGLPPLLGIGVSLLILAGAVVSFEHDATWMATTLVGAILGLLRGRQIAVQTDQVWGTVRMPVVHDTVIAAFCIFAIASVDALSGLFKPGTFPRHAPPRGGQCLLRGLSLRARPVVDATRRALVTHRARTLDRSTPSS